MLGFDDIYAKGYSPMPDLTPAMRLHFGSGVLMRKSSVQGWGNVMKTMYTILKEKSRVPPIPLANNVYSIFETNSTDGSRNGERRLSSAGCSR